MNSFNFDITFTSNKKEVIKKLGYYFDYNLNVVKKIANKNPYELYHREYQTLVQILYPNFFITSDKYNDFIAYKIKKLKNGKIKLIEQAIFPRINVRNRIIKNIKTYNLTLIDLILNLIEKNNIEPSSDWIKFKNETNIYS